MDNMYDRSPLWDRYGRTQVTKGAVADLANFKSNEVNFKLALWDPRVNGVRYLKTLIHALSSGLSAANWTRLRNIRERTLGNPIAIRYDGETVCLDYLQAVFEVEFMSAGVELDGAAVVEIGAGYGRTCHAMLSNHDVADYHIIDLENLLTLSSGYLRAVLDDEQFAKVRFHPVADVAALFRDHRFELCVNIDSFAEMNAETVHAYLARIAESCRHLYVNNPVGKYMDKSLDGHSQGNEVVALALRTGLLRDIIDIHDNRAVEAQSRKFVTAYLPGDDWRCVAESRTIAWPYYWQALYRNDR
ncbi:putative sugar O-methyltransferase [Spongiactinospora sp. TRM90649]|uniref:putative sugar O-methyltransferase n=1 Tax=Spongiactinospora sp. TRM90649 TaxID=3031114 RepID=UPI0023F91275|nr:putative sugar O-methyltransferase [Spongiactinospora sp. TRM90649]